MADVFGDFREEILLRTEDSTAIRVYTTTDVTTHKLHTLMHDVMYRCGAAWQNNCYNQPGYPSFYYAHDMWQYTFTAEVEGIHTVVDMNLRFIEK